MISATSDFVAALAYSHHPLTRITVDDVVMRLISGSLSIDGTRNTRRTCPGMRLGNDPGTEATIANITTSSVCTVEKGIRYLDRSEEYATIATMRVQELSLAMKNLYIDLALADDGQLVDDYPLIRAYAPVSAGVAISVVDAIQFLVEEPLPTAPTWTVSVDAAALAQMTPDGMLFPAGTGRWAAIRQLAESIGAQVFAGPDGGWNIKQTSTIVSPVCEFTTGAGGVLVDAVSKASRRDVFNGVGIEWGTAEIPGSVALVTDDDPTSPTYWLGPWGKRPQATQKLPLTTEAEAIIAGRAILAASKGAQSGLDLTAVYNPLLEPGDIVGVTRSTAARQMHVIDAIELGLVAATMTARTRVVSS